MGKYDIGSIWIIGGDNSSDSKSRPGIVVSNVQKDGNNSPFATFAFGSLKNIRAKLDINNSSGGIWKPYALMPAYFDDQQQKQQGTRGLVAVKHIGSEKLSITDQVRHNLHNILFGPLTGITGTHYRPVNVNTGDFLEICYPRYDRRGCISQYFIAIWAQTTINMHPYPDVIGAYLSEPDFNPIPTHCRRWDFRIGRLWKTELNNKPGLSPAEMQQLSKQIKQHFDMV